MDSSDVTVVVVPRERFSFARESLESIYERTPGLVNLVYVDGGSPPPVRRYLEAQAALRGFEYVRSLRYLSPNQARNIGLRRVRTRYVVFVDNDVLFAPQWLDRLIECAEETGATIVGPIYHIDVGGKLLVHMAAGDSQIETENGKRILVEKHRHAELPLPSVPALERSETELVEFHTMLVRMELFAQTGPLDEKLLCVYEHNDLCMRARELGHRVFFEPRSIVTYVPAMHLRPSDVPYFSLRWSERWTRMTVERFQAKWRLDARDRRNRVAIHFCRHHRCRGLRLITGRTAATRRAWAAERAVVLLERCVNIAYATVASV